MIILNEKKYAENCLKNMVMPDKPYHDLFMVGKYLFTCKGVKGRELEKHLTEYLQKCSPRTYDGASFYWEVQIEKLVRRVKDYPLYSDDGVWVSKTELDKIAELGNEEWERLAFVLLCIAKLGNMRKANNNDWCNNDWAELFSLAKISVPEGKRPFYLHELYIRNYIGLAQRIDNLNLKVLYINKEHTEYSEKDGDIFVDDFRDLGYFYRMLKGQNYVRCLECGRVIKNNPARTRKYCDECQEYKPQEFKTIICVDCGKEFQVSAKNHKTQRCDECAKKFRREYRKQFMRDKRNKDNL